MLMVRVGGAKDTTYQEAHVLNDVVVSRGPTARLQRIRVRVDGAELATYFADAVIAASATGSTGYALSAGGPIVVPTVDCLVATPVCPHTLAVRPLVLPGSQILAVSPLERTDDLVLTADGQMAHELEMGMEVQFTRSSVEVPLVRFSDQNFFGTLQRKLNWAARPSG